MLKANFTKEKLDGYGVAVGFEFVNVKVTHPYRSETLKQPTFSAVLRLLKWQFYLMIYKPANVTLNRKQRRANKFH